MDYSSEVVIGFVVSRDRLDEHFMVERPVAYEEVVRYDEITGEPYKKLVTVAPSDCKYRVAIDGKTCEFDSADDMMQKLGSLVGAYVQIHGDFSTGYLLFSIEPAKMGEVDLDEGIPVATVANLVSECRRIGIQFKSRFGIDLGIPKVRSVETYR
jgi:hypothetical protein